MREILFRGKTTAFGWVFSDRIDGINYLGFDGDLPLVSGFPVKPDTLGQYTGLTDKNNVKIFEGDIVRRHSIVLGKEVICNFVVVFEDSAWRCKYRDEDRPIFIMTQEYVEMRSIEVIGNRWDNPELLED
jgi:hypothetical protein